MPPVLSPDRNHTEKKSHVRASLLRCILWGEIIRLLPNCIVPPTVPELMKLRRISGGCVGRKRSQTEVHRFAHRDESACIGTSGVRRTEVYQYGTSPDVSSRASLHK